LSAREEQAPVSYTYRLRLVVAGRTSRSQRAIENLRKICNEHLGGQVDLEVIDIYQQPELAERYQVIAAPTLVKLLPLPIRRVIGDLSEKERVLRGLEITILPPSISHEI
jgi:circadian clock protein KaiB